jgi:non-ribosomal peptide synthetase component F
MLGSWEKKGILEILSNVDANYSPDKAIHCLFEEQVAKSPHNTAIVFEDEELSYEELNKRANRLAAMLRSKGVKPDSIVGVMLERSPEMIIAILAIIKAGGAYLPIDPEFPEERINYMLEHSGARYLITQESLAAKIEYQHEMILVESTEIDLYPVSNLKSVNIAKDSIYVIYTSGSTGKPKGVVLEHRNICNFIKGVTERIPFTKEDVFLCLTTISFDIFVLEVP